MADDAEIVFTGKETVTPMLQKMEAAVTRWATVNGNTTKQAEQAWRSLDRTMGTVIGNMSKGANALGGKNSMSAGANAATLAYRNLQSQLSKTRAEMEKIAAAPVSVARGNSWINPQTQKFASSPDRQQEKLVALQREELRLLGAIDSVRASGQVQEIQRMRSVQEIQQARLNAERASIHNQEQLAKLALRNQAATAGGQSSNRASQQAMYDQMFGAKDSDKWFPPAMLRSPAEFTKSLYSMSNATRYVMYDVARNAAIGGAAILALGVGAVVVAAKWERAFADVQRTVQGTAGQLNQVYNDLANLSTQLPVSFSQLSEIASVGGQMGIGIDGIVNYTETIAKLTATTNLTADAAGKALGRFKAFFAEADDPRLAVTDQTFSNLASSILKVGVNSVATESGIVNVATQISSMGSYAGFTADQVIGLSGALSSVGVPPELSRGVITRLFNTIGEAVSENSVRLQDFAGIAGVSAEEFAASWGTDQFAYVFTDFVAGLNRMDQGAGDAVATLHELGITSVRDVPVLLRLASAAGEAGVAGGLLAQTMTDARSGWRDNIELQLQYNKIANTTSERAKVLMQSFEALFAGMGKQANGPVKELINGMIDLLKGFTLFANHPVGQVIGTIVIVTTALVGVMLLATAGAARLGGAAAGTAQALIAMGVAEEVAAVGARNLTIAIAAIGGVGLLLGIVGAITAIGIGAGEAANPIRDASGALAAMKEDTLAGGEALATFSAEQAGAEDEAVALHNQVSNLGSVLRSTEERMYGTARAAGRSAEASKAAALEFGKASEAYLRSQITSDPGFADLFKGVRGADLASALTEGGFDLDVMNRIIAKKGKEAGEKYVTEMIKSSTAFKDLGAQNELVDQGLLLQTGKQLSNLGASGFQAMKDIANGALVAGEGVVQLTSATQFAGDEMEAFKVQNEEAINAIAAGFGKFVDMGTLVGFTQGFKDAAAVQDNLETEVNESAEAVAAAEKAWADYYGGTAFSLGEYMAVFRRAAEEQQSFMANLQTLSARGVDAGIIQDLAEMGPKAAELVQALVTSTDAELQEYVNLYGTTGFDSMVALAAGQLAAQQIVMNAAKTLSTVQLQQLSADLAAGTPLTDAMAKWNLDAQGRPMKAPAQAQLDYEADQRRMQQEAYRLGFRIPVTPYLTKSTIEVAQEGRVVQRGTVQMYDTGGWTGPGGKNKPAGMVHADEFVFTKKATNAIGVSNLYRMMQQAQNGRSAPRGYANGGLVGGSTAPSTVGYTELSPTDRSLLRAIVDAVDLKVSIGSEAVAAAADTGNVLGTRKGAA